MEDVKKGLVPKELANKFKKSISIALEDKRETMFKPPPPPYVPFAGQAVSLGGGPAQPVAVATKAVDLSNSQNKPIVNPNKPTTQVSIRLHNGQQVKLDLNMDHTVRDIAKYIETIAPVSGSYKLIAGFPPKALEDMNATVEGAKLAKSAITQKL